MTYHYTCSPQLVPEQPDDEYTEAASMPETVRGWEQLEP
jgi:hypothetical protein